MKTNDELFDLTLVLLDANAADEFAQMIAPKLAPGGQAFATGFEIGRDHQVEEAFRAQGLQLLHNIVSSPRRGVPGRCWAMLGFVSTG